MRHMRALMLGVALLCLVVACVGYTLLNEIRSPVSVVSKDIEITIESGDTTSDIATKLRAADLIRQPIFFAALVRFQKLEGKLQAGRYVLSPTMTMSDILIALQNSRVEEIQVTIPEGLRLEEIATRIGATGVVDEAEFLRAARDSSAFKESYFLLNSLPSNSSLEGYLFPDTYRIAATAGVTEIISLMLDNFNEQYNKIERDVRVPNVNVHQILTMASIVQREAALTSEMPKIASVFWNRLKPENAAETGGGKLQADPTVQYALGYSLIEQTWWRKNLTMDDLRIANPYNTRIQIGLPPGPISNPGLEAIRAAAQPDESANFLYFVADCAKDGSHNFASNLAEFQQYEAEFQSCSS